MLKSQGCDIESLFEEPNIIGKDRNYMSPLSSLEENGTLSSGQELRSPDSRNADLKGLEHN